VRWIRGLEKIKLIATVAVATYPLFAGLYVLGFFWTIPFDLVSAFPATDFIFKSAVTFFSIAAVFVGYLLFMTMYYFAVVEKIAGNRSDSENSEEKRVVTHKQWKDLGGNEIALTLGIHLLIISLIVASFWIEEWSGFPQFAPDILALALFLLFLMANLVRLSFDYIRWMSLKWLFVMLAVIVLPVWIGFQDSKLSDGAPTFSYDNQACRARFIGSQKVLAVCNRKDVLIQSQELTVDYK
jgi:hypothetical protein